MSGLRLPITRGEAAYLAVTLFFALFVSVLGVLLGLAGAHDRWSSDRTVALTAHVVVTLVAAWLSVRPLLGL